MAETPKIVQPANGSQPEFIPARMLNEFTYCPRLGYLEWVQGEYTDNAFTLDGGRVHRRVDRESGELPEPGEEPGEGEAPVVSRSVLLSASRADLIAKIDLVEAEGGSAIPVDYKRGKKPDLPEGAYEPERVQLCAQGIILRENGYDCPHGVLYFVDSRERVVIEFDEQLVDRTLELAGQFRDVAASGNIPPPLEGSPKCNGCSLVGICLPDEVGLLRAQEYDRKSVTPRRLIPARDDAMPVYVQGQGLFVGKSGDQLVVKEKGKKVAEARLFETSQLNLVGNVQISTQAVRELCSRGIPICHFTTGGWFYGMTRAELHKNVELRIQQYRAFDDPRRALDLSRRFVATKIRNCRTLLRRNATESDEKVLRKLSRLAGQAAPDR